MSVLSIGAQLTAGETENTWKLFAPLPDRVGFSGMVAGVLDGRLVVAGGSQFPRAPNWLKGEKEFSDRIFILRTPQGTWETSPSRLPLKIANPAMAATSDAIFFAGGISGDSCSNQAWAMRASGENFVFTRLPDLPAAVGYSAGAIVNGRFYVACGIPNPTSKAPVAKVWSLGILSGQTGAGWRTEPDIPGPGVFVPAGASWKNHFYVFGGFGYDTSEKGIPAAGAYALDVRSQKWERLPDLPAARVGISSPCPVQNGEILAIGGYSQVFPGAARDHPGFDRQTYAFDSAKRVWKNGPLLPSMPVIDRDASGDAGPAPMIAAPCVVWEGYAVVVGGEVRASVRTPAVVAWPLQARFSR